MTADGLVQRIVDRSYGPPLASLRGVGAATIFYPLAETLERRDVRSKVAALRRYQSLPQQQRASLAREQLVDTLRFAGAEVPYYRDLFASLAFDPERVGRDPKWLSELPLLTKAIINEQGDRLLSRPLAETRHHLCKTGGSTGEKAVIYYDQAAADHSSAVTTYARDRIGAHRSRSTLHFAARLPDTPREHWPNRETFKCLAMNRSNIFFSALDPASLDAIWRVLQRRAPYLVHAHPSTVYALACHLRDTRGSPVHAPFEIFESSGELLDATQRKIIADTFGCRIVDRYGLAEFGVLAYEFGNAGRPDIFESECWPESLEDGSEPQLVVTGFRNRLMPLIRYKTGDLALVEGEPGALRLGSLMGRIHDVVEIDGVQHLTHHLQDVLDHRVEGIRDFQFDLRTTPPTLRIAPQEGQDTDAIAKRIRSFWREAFTIQFVPLDGMVRVGDRAKFRHVVTD